MIIFLRQLSTFRPLNSSIKNEVRVRFAPSPTGSIHFGGLRTALYNYIFARQNGGSFILRIEDTDQNRIVPGSSDEIDYILNWMGLRPDEGPNYGGCFGPYLQSERLNIYEKHVKTLLKNGKAYRCFCSPSRLELLRKYQINNREKPRYDGKCKHLSHSQIVEKMNSHESYTVRFSFKPGVTSFDDMVFGTIETDLIGSHEGDPIIVKSDKWPTYHFANVVDDHEMSISHVFRGCEWIPSTAKHIQMYDAFGWDKPVFSHLPLISMKDGSKMSKRNNQSQIKSYIDEGFLPLAILNLLTNMGGGISKVKQDSMDVWNLETIIKNFDLNKVICHPGSIDLDRLRRYNNLSLNKIWKENPESLIEQLRKLLADQGYSSIQRDEDLTRIIECFIDGRVTKLNDLVSEENSYLWRQPELKFNQHNYKVPPWDIRKIVKHVEEKVEAIDINNKDEVITSLKDVSNKLKLDWPNFMKLLRLVLTNKETGQPVYDIFRCLGKVRLLEYLVYIRDHIK